MHRTRRQSLHKCPNADGFGDEYRSAAGRVCTPDGATLGLIGHIARLQRIDEHLEGKDCLTDTRSPSHSAIVSGNATYWDPCRPYRGRVVLPTLQQRTGCFRHIREQERSQHG